MTGKRVTLVLSDENLEYYHKLQSKMIAELGESVSFSKVVNIGLEKGRRLKK